MARNGSGTFTITDGVLNGPNVCTQQKAAGVDVTASRMDVILEDIATALTGSIAKDGQTTPTANLPMGGFKLTNLAAGSGNGDSVRYQQIVPDIQSYTPVASGSGVTQNAVYGEYVNPYGKILDFSGEVNVTLASVSEITITIPGGYPSQSGRSQIVLAAVNASGVAIPCTAFIASNTTSFVVHLPTAATGTFVIDYRGSIRVQ